MQYISDIDRIIINALREDIPSGDITTDNIIDETSQSEAVLISKDEGVIADWTLQKRSF